MPLKLVIGDDRSAVIPYSLAPGGRSAVYLMRHSTVLMALLAGGVTVVRRLPGHEAGVNAPPGAALCSPLDDELMASTLSGSV